MFTEKTKLLDQRENAYYGSYKENNVLEEKYWQNKQKRQQLAMVAAVVLILVLLSIGITLAITLPPILNAEIYPEDPNDFLSPSPSVLGIYNSAGISSESQICSDLGKDVLQNKNGSAVDAAVVVTLCHGVTNPQSSGIGGGLFMVVYEEGGPYVVNGREVAPAGVDPEAYETNPSASVRGGLSVGVPGELAGLWEAHQRSGKVAWAELVGIVREVADNGFTVSAQLAKTLKEHEGKIKGDLGLRSEFVNPETNEVWKEGDLLIRSKLARTLQQVEENGASDFYNGNLANEIIREIGEANGIITLGDLTNYSAYIDTPFSYPLTHNLTLYSLGFPSSGPVVALGLGILHGFGKKHSDEMSPKERGLDEHQVVEAFKFAYAHRPLVADPDFTDVSQMLEQILSPTYADELRSLIDPFKTFEDPRHYGAVYSSTGDEGTSHISILGPNGDAVSLTTSINLGFGSGFMGSSTGIIYNNIMNDFSIGNNSDAFGLPPNGMNSIEPGKRPGSSMTPLIVVNEDGLPVLATGGSGGGKIISSVISTTWRALYRALDIKTAIDYPRFIPRFSPADVYYEFGLPSFVTAELRRKGHRMTRLDTLSTSQSYIGNVNSVCRAKETGHILSNADDRKKGGSAGF